MSAIDAGIHAIRAGRHLCDEALRYLWTGTSRRYLNLFYALAESHSISQPLLTADMGLRRSALRRRLRLGVCPSASWILSALECWVLPAILVTRGVFTRSRISGTDDRHGC